MSKVSIIIPARGESYENLRRTIQSVVDNATGDYEILVGLDGAPHYDFLEYPQVTVLKFPAVVGIKTNINALSALARGEYIYKSDAHCSFSRGFDEVMSSDMKDDWIMVPRFYVLDGNTWQWQDERFYDYFYLCCPFTDPRGLRFKAGGHWPERTAERLDTPIDETPQIHGSGWMMKKEYYFEGLGGFPNIDIYGHAQEPIWLALKNWLAGGKVMVNKKAWYAHMHQQNTDRGYRMDSAQDKRSYTVAVEYWLQNKWHERKHDFEWFVERFSPMPTWPENWKEILHKYQEETKK